MKKILSLFFAWALVYGPFISPLSAQWINVLAGSRASGGGGGGSFTYHATTTVLTSATGTTRTRTCTVSTGDLVVVWASNLSAQTMTVSATDTVHTDTFTALTLNTGFGNSTYGQFFYCLASACDSGSGTYTVTVTYAATSIYRGVTVTTLTPSSAASFDLEGGAVNSVNGGSFTTGSITTTGTTEVVFCGSVESAGNKTTSAATIGGVAADANGTYNSNTTFWRTGTSLGSVAGAATFSASTSYGAQLAAFKL